jgi:hypothetical protein
METVRIRDPGWRQFGSGMKDGDSSDPGCGMEKCRIRDKHPGSATLALGIFLGGSIIKLSLSVWQEAVIAQRKKKIAWLLIEQEMIDTELAIKSCLKVPFSRLSFILEPCSCFFKQLVISTFKKLFFVDIQFFCPLLLPVREVCDLSAINHEK